MGTNAFSGWLNVDKFGDPDLRVDAGAVSVALVGLQRGRGTAAPRARAPGVKNIMDLIWEQMSREFMKHPSLKDWWKIKGKFDAGWSQAEDMLKRVRI